MARRGLKRLVVFGDDDDCKGHISEAGEPTIEIGVFLGWEGSLLCCNSAYQRIRIIVSCLCQEPTHNTYHMTRDVHARNTIQEH